MCNRMPRDTLKKRRERDFLRNSRAIKVESSTSGTSTVKLINAKHQLEVQHIKVPYRYELNDTDIPALAALTLSSEFDLVDDDKDEEEELSGFDEATQVR